MTGTGECRGRSEGYRPGGSPCLAHPAPVRWLSPPSPLRSSSRSRLAARRRRPRTAFAAASAAPGAAIAPGPHAHVQRSGDVDLRPDTAVIGVPEHGEGASSDAAQAVATDKMKAVLQALRSLDTVNIGDAIWRPRS